MPQTVTLHIQDAIAIITLNRPDKLNAFNKQQHIQLKSALEKGIQDRAVRVIILTGAGRGFCAGQDLSDRNPAIEYDLGDTLEKYYNPLIRLIRRCPKPIICAVNGVSAGAGVSLALACDIIIACDTAKFIQAFSKIGLVPDSGASWFLPRAIGEHRAKYLAMTGDSLSANDAYLYGLVHQVVGIDTLMSETLKIAKKLARGPAVSYKLIKDAIHQAPTNTLDRHLDLERDYQRMAGKTRDYKEGVQAFMENRPPHFTGK